MNLLIIKDIFIQHYNEYVTSLYPYQQKKIVLYGKRTKHFLDFCCSFQNDHLTPVDKTVYIYLTESIPYLKL